MTDFIAKDLYRPSPIDEEPKEAGPPPEGPLLLRWDNSVSPITLTRTIFTEIPEPVFNTPVDSQTVDLLKTSGMVMAQGIKSNSFLVMSGNDFALDTIQELAYEPLNNELGRYELRLDFKTNIGGDAKHSIFPPTELDGNIYWVELDDFGPVIRLSLSRVQRGAINTSQVIETFIDVDKTEIDFGTVQDVHFDVMLTSFRNTNSYLFKFNNRWHAYGRLRWYDGASYIFDNFQAVFEDPGIPGFDTFFYGTPGLPLKNAGGIVLPGLIDGNRCGLQETIGFGANGCYNMRLNNVLDFAGQEIWQPVGAGNTMQSSSMDSLSGSLMLTRFNSGSTKISRGDPEGTDFTETVILDTSGLDGFTIHGLWI